MDRSADQNDSPYIASNPGNPCSASFPACARPHRVFLLLRYCNSQTQAWKPLVLSARYSDRDFSFINLQNYLLVCSNNRMPGFYSKTSYLFAGIVGFALPFLTGFFGLLPIDQSIVFEAGGRISRGELPFTDFYIPYGLVPALAQAAFFKLFGVSWFSYVLHAAVVNGLFAVVVLDVLRIWLPLENKNKLLAGTMLVAWSFYPMMGTPFMDDHSFFFGFLAYWAALSGIVRRNNLILFCCFPFLVFGFYSK